MFAPAGSHRVLKRGRRTGPERGRDPGRAVDDLQPGWNPVDESEVGQGCLADVSRPDGDGHLVTGFGSPVAHGAFQIERCRSRFPDSCIEAVADSDRADEHEPRLSEDDPDSDERQRDTGDPFPSTRLDIAESLPHGRFGLIVLPARSFARVIASGGRVVVGCVCLHVTTVAHRFASATDSRSASEPPTPSAPTSPASSRSIASMAAGSPNP